MGTKKPMKWNVFLNRHKRATEVIYFKMDEFYGTTGEWIEVRFKCYKGKADIDETIGGDDEFKLRTLGIPMMEISEIRGGEGKATESLLHLISADLPICGSDPKKVIQKFNEIFDEAMGIVKKELHIQ
jgi:hypothetical protein